MNAEIKERIEMIYRGEVPQGYKKTKVGIIPEDWEETRLDKVSKITMGQSPSSANYNENGIGLPLIQGNADIKDRYTSPRLFTSEITKTCEVDDIIMSVRAPVGEIAKSVHKACIGRGVCSIRPVENNYYLYHYLINNERLWTRYSQGSTFESVNSSDIKKFSIVTPKSKIEQQKIAQILSTWDQAIELKEKLIEQKKEQKKGLMQKLLTGEVRLPGFDGEWEEVRLGDISTMYSGGTPQTSNKEYYNGSIPWINSGDLNQKKIRFVERKISRKGLENSSAKMVSEGDLLIALYGATAGIVGISCINAAINQAVLAIIPEKDEKMYLYYQLDFLKDSIINRYTQGGQPNLSGAIIKSLKINLPPLQEQKAIAQILTTADKEIELLNQELEQLKLQKKGLMQLLLTGIIRVKS